MFRKRVTFELVHLEPAERDNYQGHSEIFRHRPQALATHKYTYTAALGLHYCYDCGNLIKEGEQYAFIPTRWTVCTNCMTEQEPPELWFPVKRDVRADVKSIGAIGVLSMDDAQLHLKPTRCRIYFVTSITDLFYVTDEIYKRRGSTEIPQLIPHMMVYEYYRQLVSQNQENMK